MIIMAVLSVGVVTRVLPSNTSQLQASRDSIVAAFQSAQLLAMSRQHDVSLSIASNTVAITLDGNPVSIGGVQYPLALIPGQSLTSATFSYNRLGYTQARDIQLSQNGNVVKISIDGSGYVR